MARTPDHSRDFNPWFFWDRYDTLACCVLLAWIIMAFGYFLIDRDRHVRLECQQRVSWSVYNIEMCDPRYGEHLEIVDDTRT